MVVDTSALIAIMNNEPERRRFNELIEAATATYVSAASLLEARMVLFARSGDNAVLALDAFLLKNDRHGGFPSIADIAFDGDGKGSGHEAALNYGDAFLTPRPAVFGRPTSVQGRRLFEDRPPVGHRRAHGASSTCGNVAARRLSGNLEWQAPSKRTQVQTYPPP